MNKCFYLIHVGTSDIKATGEVITSQHKAWNDQIRMAMWVDLIVAPIKARDGKMLLWFDNCGCHTTELIEEKFKEQDVDVARLPPNMTGLLQVLDLAVNGPLKAHVRKLRARRIVNAFKKYKTDYIAQRAEGNQVGEFKPPAASIYQGISR
jgi:hypothetical protein